MTKRLYMRTRWFKYEAQRLSLLALPVFLASCSLVGPDYVKPDTNVPAQWAYAQNANVSASQEDISAWWRQLGDGTLSSLIDDTLKASPDLRLAQAKLREARARLDLTKGNLLPTLSASVDASRSRSSAETGSGSTNNLFKAGFDVSWEADVFGGIRRGVEAAENDLAATQADLYNTHVSLAAETALNYVLLRSSQSRLAIAMNNLQTQTETLQITEWREQAGLATAVEVEQARTNMEQTRASIPLLNSSAAEAENRLAILLGEPPASLRERLQQSAGLPQLPGQVAAGIPAETLRQRPDIRAAEFRLIAETARVGQQTAELYPSFTLSGNFGWQALTMGALGNSGTVASALLAGVSQTVFDGGRIRSQINIQNAIQEQALVTYEKTILTALEEVENALASYGNNRQRQDSLRRAAVSAENAAVLARQRFESGLIDFQSVLDTERTRLTVEDSLASSEADGLSSLITLYKSLGGGWTEDSSINPNQDTTTSVESTKP